MTTETLESLDSQIQALKVKIKTLEDELETEKASLLELRIKRRDLFLAEKSAEFGFELKPDFEVRCTIEMHLYALNVVYPKRPDIVHLRFYVGATLSLEDVREDGIHLYSDGGRIAFPPDMVKRALEVS